MPLHHRLALAAAVLLLAAPPAIHAAVVLAPDELPLNGVDGVRQRWPAVAMGPTSALVGWEDDVHGVMLRTLDFAGNPAPPRVAVPNDPLPTTLPFRVRVREQHEPALARRADGGYLLVWTEELVERSADIFIENTLLISTRVVARLLRADGTPSGAPIEIARGPGYPAHAAVVATKGEYWVAWDESDALKIRRVDKRGKLGKPAVVVYGGVSPTLAYAGDVIAVGWRRAVNDVTSQVSVRLYRSSGRTIGGILAMETLPGHAALNPTIAGRAGGSFLVAWESWSAAPDYTLGGQLVSRMGTKVGRRLTLANADEGSRVPRLAATVDGWVMTWIAGGGGSRYGLRLGTFNVAGTPTGEVSDVDLVGHPIFDDHVLAIGPGGHLLSSWVSRDDAALISIQGRLGQASAPAPR